MEQSGQGLLFSQQECRASLQVVPGSSEARKMTAGSGRKLSVLLPKQSLAGACLKILLESSTWASTEYLLTWKPSGTRRGFAMFRLVPSTPPNSGIGCGSWLTPRKTMIFETQEAFRGRMNRHRANDRKDGFPNLAAQMEAATWRTPQRHNAEQGPKSLGFMEHCLKTGQSQITLTDQVKTTWPTPTKRDDKGQTQNPEKMDYVPNIVMATWPIVRSHGNSSWAGATSQKNEIDWIQKSGYHSNIEEALAMATWPTVCKGDRTTPREKLRQSRIDTNRTGGYISEVCGTLTSGHLARTEKFVERLTTLSAWLMGYPEKYLRHWGTP